MPDGTSTAQPGKAVTPLLAARKVEFSRRDGFSLRVSAFELAENESVAIIGPNGAGKTTLLKILARLEEPKAGELVFAGKAVIGRTQTREYYRQTAYVPQSMALYDTSVFENVAIGLRIRGAAKAEIRDRVAAVLGRFGIEGLASRNAHRISGGEGRRVALARALVLAPRILFLDEPFGELDLPVKEEIMTELSGVLHGMRCAKVIVTHDRDEALWMAERFVVMINGAVAQVGTVAEVFNTPASPEVAAFVGVKNIFSGTVSASESGVSVVALEGGVVLQVAGELQAGSRVVLAVPPESVVLVGGGDGELAPASARNVLKGTVAGVTPFRYGLWVKLDCGFPLAVCVTRQAVSSLGLAIGARLRALIKATAIHVIECAR